MRAICLATLATLAAACTPTGDTASAPAPASVPAITEAPESMPAPAPAPVLASLPVAASSSSAQAPAPVAAVVDMAAGKALFNDWSCGTCHTLAAAGGTGGVGPAFDGNARLTVDYAKGIVTNGQGAMPAFGGQMTDAEITTIASYIVAVKK